MSEDGSTTIDDKYSVTLGCRYDDDNDGGNEWEGAWMHSNTTLLAEKRSSSSSNSEETSSGTLLSSENNSTNFITMAEVRKHNTEDDLWMVLENKVFDLTDFVSIHPGGPGYLIMNAGMDGTDPFQDVHFGIFARAEIMEYYIGDLDMSSKLEWVFEMSRPLETDSTKTDAQFMEGSSVDFGFSFWDPHESENCWTNSGYYTTGSTKSWMSLQIGQQIIEDTKVESTSNMTSTVASSSSSMDVWSFGCTSILTIYASLWIV